MKTNNLNPDFTQKITMNYYFEKVQKLKFVMIDADDNSGSGDEIGICETTLGNIMGARQQTFTTDLIEPGRKDKRGQIIIRAEAIQSSNQQAIFRARFQDCGNFQSGCCGSTILPVTLNFQRMAPNGSW